MGELINFRERAAFGIGLRRHQHQLRLRSALEDCRYASEGTTCLDSELICQPSAEVDPFPWLGTAQKLGHLLWLNPGVFRNLVEHCRTQDAALSFASQHVLISWGLINDDGTVSEATRRAVERVFPITD